MNEEKYQESVISLMNGDLTFDEKLGNFALGLVCETGEVIEAIDAKNKDKVLDELSDTRWYFTANAILLKLEVYIDLYSMYAGASYWYENIEKQLLLKACKYGDLIKKVIYHKHPLEQHKKELMSLLFEYYVLYRRVLTGHNLTDEQVKQYNYDKLNARYKGLKFTTDQSINRNNEILNNLGVAIHEQDMYATS